MLSVEEVERLSRTIGQLSRVELVEQFRIYPAPFPIDFTDAFLASQSVEKLRHVFFGLCLHCGAEPQISAPALSCLDESAE